MDGGYLAPLLILENTTEVVGIIGGAAFPPSSVVSGVFKRPGCNSTCPMLEAWVLGGAGDDTPSLWVPLNVDIGLFSGCTRYRDYEP